MAIVISFVMGSGEHTRRDLSRSCDLVSFVLALLGERGEQDDPAVAKQRRPATIAGLQAQLERFRAYYNAVRPHRALGRRTPAQAFAARTKATPRRPGITVPAEHRVRRDRIDSGGKVTLRYQSRLLHLGVGRRYRGTRVLLLVADRDVRVLNDNGEILAEFTIDPTKTYQTQNRPGRGA